MIVVVMIDIGILAAASGIRRRKLRYVLDHELLPGIVLTAADARGTRLMTTFDAFAVLLAARMLATGCPKGMVRDTLGRLYAAPARLVMLSLHAFWLRKARLLRIGDTRTVFVAGCWYAFNGQAMASTYVPAIELRFSLSQAHQVIAAASRQVWQLRRDSRE